MKSEKIKVKSIVDDLDMSLRSPIEFIQSSIRFSQKNPIIVPRINNT